jgi:hypothetical protein
LAPLLVLGELGLGWLARESLFLGCWWLFAVGAIEGGGGGFAVHAEALLEDERGGGRGGGDVDRFAGGFGDFGFELAVEDAVGAEVVEDVEGFFRAFLVAGQEAAHGEEAFEGFGVFGILGNFDFAVGFGGLHAETGELGDAERLEIDLFEFGAGKHFSKESLAEGSEFGAELVGEHEQGALGDSLGGERGV